MRFRKSPCFLLVVTAATVIVSTSAAEDAQIRITTVPRYDPIGGPNSSDHIEGRVIGVKPRDFRVVIYARTDYWYVQPEIANPMTPINKDGLWSATIHTGSRYAALLVRPTYNAPPKITVLPNESTDPNNIVASTELEGAKKGP